MGENPNLSPLKTHGLPMNSLILYQNLPQYARFLDDTTILEHICDSAQPELDTFWRWMRDREILFDPDATPERFLPFLQQFVGGASINGQHLGLGLDPDWEPKRQREFIKRLWWYWELKGTEAGIREAINMWLDWDALNYLEIRHPFGLTPTSTPPNWWGWDTPFDAHLYQTYPDRQHLGAGDSFQGNLYYPDRFSLQPQTWYWEYGSPTWTNREMVITPPEELHGRSHLGARCPWAHYNLIKEEWEQIYPDIHTLNPEIWPANTRPTTFGWFDYADRSRVLQVLQGDFNPDLLLEQKRLALVYYGWQYGDLYYYPARDEQTRVVTSIVSEEVSVLGATWGFNWWASVGGVPVPAESRVTTITETVEGNYPGASWYDSWYAKYWIFQNYQVEDPGTWVALWEYENLWYYPATNSWIGIPIVQDPGSWTPDLWEYQLNWYYPARDEWMGDPVGEGSMPGVPYYSPTEVVTYQQIDPGIPSLTPAIPGTLYSVPPQIKDVEKTEIIIDPPVACNPGGLVELQTGMELAWVPPIDAIPASEILRLVTIPGQAITEGVVSDGNYEDCFDYWDNWCTTQRFSPKLSHEFSLDSTFSLSQPYTLEPPPQKQTVVNFQSPIAPGIFWYFPPQDPATTVIPGQTSHGLQPNPAIALYSRDWNSAYQWYWGGSPELEGYYIDVPKVERVPLCNISIWSDRTIVELEEVITEIDPEQYSFWDAYPDIAAAQDSQQWFLYVETKEELIAINPVTMFWRFANGKRSLSYDPDQISGELYMEFVATTSIDQSSLRSLALFHQKKLIFFDSFDRMASDGIGLAIPNGHYGWKFAIPTKLNPPN